MKEGLFWIGDILFFATFIVVIYLLNRKSK